jgi:hypothetical protein
MGEHRQRLRKSLQEKAGGWVDVSRSIFDDYIEARRGGTCEIVATLRLSRALVVKLGYAEAEKVIFKQD